MLYLAIDQHAKQITVVVRNSDGEDVFRDARSALAPRRSKRSLSSC